MGVPLRYNYDKPEKPRRIKGFEVFSLVFSSFSKPKNHTEISRISGVTNPVDGECQVTAQIISDDVSKDFSVTGVLLFAEDPDLGEVPYTYLVLESAPEPIKSSASTVGKFAIFVLVAAVGAVDNVILIFPARKSKYVSQRTVYIALHGKSAQGKQDIC